MKLFCQSLIIAIASFTALGTGAIGSKANHVALLSQGRVTEGEPQIRGLRDGLEELKYFDGQNLHLNLLQEEKLERLDARLRTAIKYNEVDVIVTLGTTETVLARDITGTIPIVFLPATDPVQHGFVRSLAAPQMNLTGLTFFTDSQNVGKQLDMFKEVVPALRQVITLIDARQLSNVNSQVRKNLAHVAAGIGIQLTEHLVRSSAEALAAVVSYSKPPQNTGIFIICSGLFRDIKELAVAAAKKRFPLFGCSASQVAEQKAFMTYAPDLYAIGYRGAWFVDRILKGVSPKGMAVETPRKFELIINRKVAQELGLKVPVEMLIVADRVFTD